MKQYKIKDFIHLKRIKILEEDSDSYKIEYNSQIYEIAKDSESHFVQNSPSAPSMGLTMVLEQRLEMCLVPETEIFQDEKAPQEFKEVMMFHEIREMEYKNAGFDDAHIRAMNDEILYIQKFFDGKTQKKYLRFASDYRQYPVIKATIAKLMEVTKEELEKKKVADRKIG